MSNPVWKTLMNRKCPFYQSQCFLVPMPSLCVGEGLSSLGIFCDVTNLSCSLQCYYHTLTDWEDRNILVEADNYWITPCFIRYNFQKAKVSSKKMQKLTFLVWLKLVQPKCEYSRKKSQAFVWEKMLIQNSSPLHRGLGVWFKTLGLEILFGQKWFGGLLGTPLEGIPPWNPQ